MRRDASDGEFGQQPGSIGRKYVVIRHASLSVLLLSLVNVGAGAAQGLPGAEPGARSVTLAEAIQLSEKVQPSVIRAKADVSTAGAQVRNAWGATTYMWHQLLAQKGYIIWVCDNRTASGKGIESTWPAYKNLGELELRDLEDGLSWLKGQPYVDGTRIGMWGWSYGGFMTSYALTHSQTFKIGIAGGTVSDWRNYDSIYTERYMGTPQNNPEGYKKSAPLNAARNLQGKLLLIHGAIDDNVHMANTIQFAYELQKAGKQFELMLYPKSRHGVTDPLLLKQMRQMMTDFIVGNL